MKKNNNGSLIKLIKEFKPYYIPCIVSFICVSISVVLSILAPQFLKQLTDIISKGNHNNLIDLNEVTKIGIILIVFYLSNAILSLFSGLIMNIVTQRFAKDLRSKIVKKINRLPLSYFDKTLYGDTLSIVTNDVDQIGTSLQQSVTMLFQSVIMLTGSLIAMFITRWEMALAVLASLPLIMIMMVVIMHFAMPQFKKRQKALGEVNSVVEENFTGHLVIKAFCAEEYKEQEFDKKNNKLYSAMFKAQFFGGIMQPMMSFISYFAYAAVCLVGGLLISNNVAGVTFGTITAFMIYVQLFQNPLSQIAQSANTLQMAGASSSRVFEFLEQVEVKDEKDKANLLNGVIKGDVEFENVKFGYSEDKIIIPNFSCSVKAGMKVAIVGPTGAGKTTLVNLLMRFYELNGGDIKIDGISINDISTSHLRNVFGMVLQDSWIFEGSLKDNIIYNTKNVTDEMLNEVIKKASLEHFVKTLPNGVDTIIKDEDSLSLGQRQLITIARAILANNPLLILDEATSNVDTRTEILIQRAMDNLTENRTSFVIAHRLSTIKNADLILVLKDGDIIEQGNHKTLLEKDGFYAKLYNSQFNEE